MFKKYALFVLTALGLLFAANNAFATGGGCPTGCTPGYWKNHTDSWVKYKPTDTIAETFPIPDDYLPFPVAPLWETYGNVTLLQALSLKGGKGPEGAAEIMLRHAVAALLNSAHPEINYWWDEEWMKYTVYVGLWIGEREHLITKAAWYQAYNELLCPLN